jgi:hypothetical protein
VEGFPFEFVLAKIIKTPMKRKEQQCQRGAKE